LVAIKPPIATKYVVLQKKIGALRVNS
jgi:hypothetical protein